MKIKTVSAVSAFCFASAMGVSLAFAGAADMVSTDGDHMKFEYEGSKLRINTGQPGSYMIINDDGMYVITDTGDQIMVIDAGKMMGMFGDMVSNTPSVASSKIVSLEATGQREELAGIKGEIYSLEYVDEQSGQVQTTDLVLSADPRAIQLTKAITGMATAMVKAAGQDSKGANDLEEHMASLNKGVLRYGNDMWVTAISGRTIANSRFVLPAAPQDMSGMSGILDAINQAGSTQTSRDSSTAQSGEKTEKKGLVSGFLSAFGKKADDQADDDASDTADDSTLEKAMGKLFGN